MMYSVVDIAGVNSRLGADHDQRGRRDRGHGGRPARRRSSTGKVIAATMFGVTTPCVDPRPRAARRGSATRCSSSTPPAPADSRWRPWPPTATSTAFSTSRRPSSPTTWSAACSRRDLTGSTAAGRSGVPQVVSLGALDMVNFGPRDTVPERFEQRRLYVHNPTVTLMRTTPEECAELGRRIGRKLSSGARPDGPVRASARSVDDRRRGAAVPRPRGRRVP